MTPVGRSLATLGVAVVLFAFGGARGDTVDALPGLTEPLSLVDDVAAGRLPPVVERIPAEPSIADFSYGQTIGRYGGQLRLLMGRAKDTRQMVVYGYARLVGYNRDFEIVPDILKDVTVEDGRIFTLHIRKGHRWSDGHPFTAEDFRYYWEDIANNDEMSPAGLPQALTVNDQGPRFEILDEQTVRYTWPQPNPYFLPALARASPLFIYAPAHYLKQFHARYQDPEVLEEMVEAEGQRNWVGLQLHHARQYKNINPDLPSLQPWVLQTRPPATRFVFRRNPYFHRLDPKGQQLPYIDEVAMTIASAKLIPAKAGAGESDLQARGLGFSDYTFLKQGEKSSNFRVLLWKTAKGAEMALYPNLNTTDEVWRRLFRDVDFRRALSLGLDRHEINQVIYYGLAREANNSVLPESPLYREKYAKAWTGFAPERANRILDTLGLTERDSRGLRLLPDGRPMELIVETAGEDTEQSDVLELVRDSWMRLGIKIYTKPLQREVFRNRIFAGTTLMSVWFGLENGIPTPDSSPQELAPTSQQHLQWPKWGQYHQTNGNAGEPIDMEWPRRLARLNEDWVQARSREERAEIWHRMLDIFTDRVFTLGLVSAVRQPVVVNKRLRNVPDVAIYNWNPGGHFGVYRPDTFWFGDGSDAESAETGD